MPRKSAEPAPPRKRIAVLGMYGQLNMGNECTLQALLVNMRRMCPEAEAFCICTGPRDVVARHGVAALPMSIGGRPEQNGGVLRRLLAPLNSRLKAFRWSYTNLADTNMLIVAGTGIFEENIGLARGWLCDLLTWCLAARLRGCYLAFVSIGAGPLHTPLARAVVKGALRLAHYVSYRDRFSADYMASIGLRTTNHHIFPDLAFSLPPALLEPERPPVGASHQRVVGVGIMDYSGQRQANRRTTEQYYAYLDEIGAFISRLISNGVQVKILGGDFQYDPQVLVELKERLASRYNPPTGNALSEARFDTVEDLIAHIRDLDAVVATRFHNLVLALLLKKPTVSVSYHPKNEALMESFGLSGASQNVDELNGPALERQLSSVTTAWPLHEHFVRERLAEFRQRLDDQYRTLFLDRLGTSQRALQGQQIS